MEVTALRPYAWDLRERVAAAVDHHDGSIRGIARVFRVSTSFLVRLLQRRRAAGTLAPGPHRGGPPSGQAIGSGWPGWSASSPTRRWSN
jgi:transposase